MLSTGTGLVDAFRRTLKANGVSHIVTVANGQTLALVSSFANDPECRVIRACREGEAVAIASGLILGGTDAIVSMECTGLFESGESLRGLAVVMEIPMLLLIGYFGPREPGWEAKYEGLGGMLRNVEVGSEWLEPVLKAMGIPIYTVNSKAEIENLETALRETRERSGPVAVLVEMLGE